MTKLGEFVELLAKASAGGLLVVTGAGVSLASGLPTFRGTDPGAIWADDILEKGTFSYFRRKPVAFWTWYLERFGGLLNAAPNPSHRALVELEQRLAAREQEFLLVTQNVDGLHRAAGSRALIEVHGRADRVRCSAFGCEMGEPSGSLPFRIEDYAPFLESHERAALPLCPRCRALLRPHVLWFDEVYNGHDDYQFTRVIEWCERTELILFAGTSFSVGITELVLRAARLRRTPVFSIDPAPQERIPGVQVIQEAAEVALPAIAARFTAH